MNFQICSLIPMGHFSWIWIWKMQNEKSQLVWTLWMEIFLWRKSFIHILTVHAIQSTNMKKNLPKLRNSFGMSDLVKPLCWPFMIKRILSINNGKYFGANGKYPSKFDEFSFSFLFAVTWWQIAPWHSHCGRGRLQSGEINIFQGKFEDFLS